MITRRSSLIDVAFAVCTALHGVGVEAVLTGGSAATFYTAKYRSRDADFVLTFVPIGVDARTAIEDLGFFAEGSHYAHEDTEFTVDFPPGPLGIGSDIIARWDTIRRDDQILHVLSRTDSVRDRLAAFYHWSDRGSLRTALVVADSGPIDMEAIREWSEREASIGKFQVFEQAFRDPKYRKRL